MNAILGVSTFGAIFLTINIIVNLVTAKDTSEMIAAIASICWTIVLLIVTRF